MSTHSSQGALQVGRDYIDSLEGIPNLHNEGEARAIHAYLEAERALRGNHSYVKVREDANLSFRVIHQPHGVPEDHVRAMQENTEKYPTLEVYLLDENGKMIDLGYVKNDEVPQIEQRRIQDDADLTNSITDKVEVARIRDVVAQGGKYPLLSYLNPLALELYAKHMGKRLSSGNVESRNFLYALPGETIEEKFANAGLPFPGYFNADDEQVYGDGQCSLWVSSAPLGNGFQTLGLLRDYRDAFDDGIEFSGSSPLLKKTKKISA